MKKNKKNILLGLILMTLTISICLVSFKTAFADIDDPDNPAGNETPIPAENTNTPVPVDTDTPTPVPATETAAAATARAAARSALFNLLIRWSPFSIHSQEQILLSPHCAPAGSLRMLPVFPTRSDIRTSSLCGPPGKYETRWR